MILCCYRCGRELEQDEAMPCWSNRYPGYVCLNTEDCEAIVNARLLWQLRLQRQKRKGMPTAAMRNLQPGAEPEVLATRHPRR